MGLNKRKHLTFQKEEVKDHNSWKTEDSALVIPSFRPKRMRILVKNKIIFI